MVKNQVNATPLSTRVMLFAFVVSSPPAASTAVSYTRRNSEGSVHPSKGVTSGILKPGGQRAVSSPTLSGEFGSPWSTRACVARVGSASFCGNCQSRAARVVSGGYRWSANSRRRTASSCWSVSYDPLLAPPCAELFASSSKAWAGGTLAAEARLLLVLRVAGAASAAKVLGLALIQGAMSGYWVSAS